MLSGYRFYSAIFISFSISRWAHCLCQWYYTEFRFAFRDEWLRVVIALLSGGKELEWTILTLLLLCEPTDLPQVRVTVNTQIKKSGLCKRLCKNRHNWPSLNHSCEPCTFQVPSVVDKMGTDTKYLVQLLASYAKGNARSPQPWHQTTLSLQKEGGCFVFLAFN